MPERPCTCPDGRPGLRWGKSGKCYCYTAGDPRSLAQAHRRVLAQAAAIHSRRDRMHRRGPDVPGGVLRRLQRLYDARAERLRLLLRELVREQLSVRVDALRPNEASALSRQIALAVVESLALVTENERQELAALSREVVPYTARKSTTELRRLTGAPVPLWWGFKPSEVQREVDIFRRWNEDLLVDLTRRYGEQVQEDVIKAVARAGTEEDVVESLVSRYAMTMRRGAFIARDQTTKLTRSLEIGRHVAIGLESYFWRTVGDGVVRPLHVQREGVRFLYSDPPRETPDDGHPGTPIGCRCYPEPEVEGLILPDLGSPLFASPVGGNPPPVDGLRLDPTSGDWVVA